MLCTFRDVYLDIWVDGSVLNTHVSCLFWLKLEGMYLCMCGKLYIALCIGLCLWMLGLLGNAEIVKSCDFFFLFVQLDSVCIYIYIYIYLCGIEGV